jgi:hypothetical protein
MGKLDTLSRRADHRSGQEDNNNLTLLAPELFRIHALAGARLEATGATFSERFGAVLEMMHERNQWQRQLGSFRRTRAEAQSKAQSGLRVLLMFCGKISVPRDRELRCHIVEQHHDTCIAGHADHFKTLKLIS